ncbi:MAG: hypothetical protein Kow00106_19190 [Anaerolineae bacterium]
MRLFISYSHADKPLVTEIAKLFIEAGYEVWFDHRLLPGESWKEILSQEISQSDVFVYALSPESVNSQWCQWEYATAAKLGKRILPILLQKNTPLPEELKQYQYADFSDTLDATSVARLMGGLARMAVSIPPGSKPNAPENPSGMPAHGVEVDALADESPQPNDSCNSQALRIVAGPGTGKTSFLMEKVTQLLRGGTNPQRILLVTFTRTAAQDIERALDERKIPQADQIRKGTLHSFCFSLLQRAEVFLQTGRVARPLLEFEERFLLEDLWSNGKFGNYYERKRRLKAFEAAWAREINQQPGWPADPIDRDFQKALDAWLRFHEAMLIEEIVPESLKYLRNNPESPERKQFDYVLVDEYQDLNRAEQSLVKLLSENGELLIVGDEDQAIYEAFRYAHPESIYQDPYFRNDKPLTICFRCPTKVVEMANNLIQYNHNRQGRTLTPDSVKEPGEIHVVQWLDMDEEARGIAQFIGQKISAGEFKPGEILILCPRRQFGYAIRDALEALGLRAHSFFHEQQLEGNPKKEGDYDAQEAFALLALTANRHDRVALRCWLGFGHENLRREQYRDLWEHCRKQGVSPLEALDSFHRTGKASRGIRELVKRYELLLKRLQDLEGKTGKDLLSAIFPMDQEWARPFHDLVDGLEETDGASELLHMLRTGIIQPELPTDVDYIRIMSLHKSKGLSADHVIVTGCIEGLIPSYPEDTIHDKDRFMEEQRRLFYVAITRPRKTLVLSSVTKLPSLLAHQMRARPAKTNRGIAYTITSNFVSELGPQCPKPIRGSDWQY